MLAQIDNEIREPPFTFPYPLFARADAINFEL